MRRRSLGTFCFLVRFLCVAGHALSRIFQIGDAMLVVPAFCVCFACMSNGSQLCLYIFTCILRLYINLSIYIFLVASSCQMRQAFVALSLFWQLHVDLLRLRRARGRPVRLACRQPALSRCTQPSFGGSVAMFEVRRALLGLEGPLGGS